MDMLTGCDPRRISENIQTLRKKGHDERTSIREAHRYAKAARKAARDAPEPAQAMSMNMSPDQG